ncbi:MAG: TlpA family protein disulfide reductase [Methylotenera sp.]|nr:TlpA family protein disulfide reductase [Methylotenera sp.]MSP98924.1 TlpA family protein disulfide reductase [Methylotenera sp.]
MHKLLLSLLLALLLNVASQLAVAETAGSANFVLKDIAGVKHQLANYKGKWVLVNYWATWCPPCLEEVPDLVSLFDRRRKKDLMIIGVVFDYESVAAVKEYVDDMLISYPIVLGDDTVIAQIGSADVMPTTFIYNPQGELVKIKRGLITKPYLEKIIGHNRP